MQRRPFGGAFLLMNCRRIVEIFRENFGADANGFPTRQP
jgi:hypothetical protein